MSDILLLELESESRSDFLLLAPELLLADDVGRFIGLAPLTVAIFNFKLYVLFLNILDNQFLSFFVKL